MDKIISTDFVSSLPCPAPHSVSLSWESGSQGTPNRITSGKCCLSQTSAKNGKQTNDNTDCSDNLLAIQPY